MTTDPERQKVLSRILQGLNIQETDMVLDVGCGDGFFSKHLIQNNGVNVISCDLQKSKRDSNLSMVRCDAQRLPFKDNCFNKVIMNEVIEHLPIAELSCIEISRVLVENGRAYVATPNSYAHMLKLFTILARRVDVCEGHFQHFSVEELIEMFSKNKMKPIHFCYDGFFALFTYYFLVYFALKPHFNQKHFSSFANHENQSKSSLFFKTLLTFGNHFLFLLGKFDELFRFSSKCMGIHLVLIKSSGNVLLP